MNKELKSKIKLISEMMSIYQTTVANETDYENIQLIKKDITNKKNELEVAKKELNFELNKLYDNGANEIDPEINQTQIIINDVDDLLDDVIPDILTYVNSPKFEKKPYNMFDNAIEKQSVKKIKVELEPKEKIDNNIVKVEPIKNEKEIKLIEIGGIEKVHNQENIQEPKIEMKFETRNNDVINNPVVQPIEKTIEEAVIVKDYQTKEDKQVKDVSAKVEQFKITNEEKKDSVNIEIKKTPSFINTIKLKQPTQDYRNTATSIVTNRIKNVTSPESAVKKAYNAAEAVMNNIMETLTDNKD